MTQKGILTTGIIIFICLAIFACRKTDTELITGKWKVESLTPHGNITSENATGTYVFEFKDNKHFSLSLDVNTCEGEYKIPRKGEISIDYPGCTKVCCDSDFAEHIKKLLPKMTEYSISGTTLILTGEGNIRLSRQ